MAKKKPDFTEAARLRSAGRTREAAALEKKLTLEAKSGITGAGAKQRKAAVKASPLKARRMRTDPKTGAKRVVEVTLPKKPHPSVASSEGETSIDREKRAKAPNAGGKGGVVDTRTPQVQAKANRDLVMSKRQIARRAARAAQRRAKGLD